MTAYMIFTREDPVFDQAEMDAYSQSNRDNAADFVGKYKMKPLIVYGAMETLEGDAPDGIVLLEFPSAAEARGWYDSPEYQAAMAHRLKGANYRVTLVEGL